MSPTGAITLLLVEDFKFVDLAGSRLRMKETKMATLTLESKIT